eukprot:76060_1
MTAPVFMSFIASLLSIIMAIATYFADKHSRQNAIFVSYPVEFCNGNISILSLEHKNNIVKRKGRKGELEKSIANSLKMSHENIEIGYVTIINNGLQMQISHCLSFKHLMVSVNTDTKSAEFQMIIMDYIYELYQSHTSVIGDTFRSHFQINNRDFTVKCIKDEERINVSVLRRFSLPRTLTLSKKYTPFPSSEPIGEIEMVQ